MKGIPLWRLNIKKVPSSERYELCLGYTVNYCDIIVERGKLVPIDTSNHVLPNTMSLCV
jgi:hypothetical protein